MLFALLLWANENKDGGGAPGLVQFMPIILIAVVFYFLIFLPGRRERQQRQAMVSALKKNDKVVTNAGIVGEVLSLDEAGDEITLKSGESKLKVLKSSIFRVLTAKEPAKEETNITAKTP